MIENILKKFKRNLKKKKKKTHHQEIVFEDFTELGDGENERRKRLFYLSCFLLKIFFHVFF